MRYGSIARRPFPKSTVSGVGVGERKKKKREKEEEEEEKGRRCRWPVVHVLTPGQVLHRATRSRTFTVSAAQRSLDSSCICIDHEQ